MGGTDTYQSSIPTVHKAWSSPRLEDPRPHSGTGPRPHWPSSSGSTTETPFQHKLQRSPKSTVPPAGATPLSHPWTASMPQVSPPLRTGQRAENSACRSFLIVNLQTQNQLVRHNTSWRALHTFLPVLLLCGGQNDLALISMAEHCAGYTSYHIHSDSGDFLS